MNIRLRGKYPKHIFREFIIQLSLNRVQGEYLFERLTGNLAIWSEGRVTAIYSLHNSIYHSALAELRESGKEDERDIESFTQVYVSKAVELIKEVLKGRIDLIKFLDNYNGEDPKQRQIMAEILSIEKGPIEDSSGDNEYRPGFASPDEYMDALVAGGLKSRYLEEELSRLRKSGLRTADLMRIAEERAENRVREFIEKMAGKREEIKKDLLWRFKKHLFNRLPGDPTRLSKYVKDYAKFDFRRNCLNILIPVKDGETRTDCYLLTIHWSDRLAMNSKSRLDQHITAAIRSASDFMKKRGDYLPRDTIERERVTDMAVMLVGNYPKKLQNS